MNWLLHTMSSISYLHLQILKIICVVLAGIGNVCWLGMAWLVWQRIGECILYTTSLVKYSEVYLIAAKPSTVQPSTHTAALSIIPNSELYPCSCASCSKRLRYAYACLITGRQLRLCKSRCCNYFSHHSTDATWTY